MSEARAKGTAKASDTAGDIERELEPIADELYTLRPDEFAAARDERVKAARAAGNAPLARELAKLRRPTQSAWLVNLLWRDQRDVMEQLFDLAAEMSRAQAQVSGAELRQLTGQRREIESMLLRRGEELARQHGVEVSASLTREAQETLSAALAQPEVADEVRSGRLVKPASYAGFGTFAPGVSDAESAAPLVKKVEKKEASKAAAEERGPNVVELRAAERARERRERAQRMVDDARAAVDDAAEELAELSRAADEAQQQHHDLRQRVEDVQTQLRELQTEAIAADRTARTAAQRRDQAEKEHAAAQRTLEHAEQQLEALTSSGQ